MTNPINSKTLSELEKEKGIVESVCDLSKRYLGLPPTKTFYKRGEVDFVDMRIKFNQAAKRIGVDAG